MAIGILPYFIRQSKEKLTDRGSLALIDEFMTGISFRNTWRKYFPVRGVAEAFPR